MTKQELNKTYYQTHKELIKARQKERYQVKKQPSKTQSKCYQAHNIKVLLSLKDYINLNKQTHKLWLDFNWTLQNLQEDIHDIVPIMKLRESAENLVNDYWTTAKSEIKKSQSWNSLTPEQQTKLIKYWGREKVRKESELDSKLLEQERQGEKLEKEIELAKFHEERGKIKCSCYDCQAKKEIRAEVKEKVFSYKVDENKSSKIQCPDCGKMVKQLNPEHGICAKCLKNYDQ